MTSSFSRNTKAIFADGGDCLNQRRSLVLRTFSPSVRDISRDVFAKLAGQAGHDSDQMNSLMLIVDIAHLGCGDE